MWGFGDLGLRPKGPKYLYNIVECRASLLGTTIMVWGSIPHNNTWDPLGRALALFFARLSHDPERAEAASTQPPGPNNWNSKA